MTRWSYMVTDMTTNRVLAQHVPFTGVTFSDTLMGGGGSFQGSFEIARPGPWSEWLSGDQLRRVIWPMRDGIPQGAYLVTEVPTTKGDAELQPVAAKRLDCILDYRVIDKTLTFVNVDQNRIFRDILLYALGRQTFHSSPVQQKNSNVLAAAQVPWIEIDYNLSTKNRTRQDSPGATDDGYPASARKLVAQELKNLCDLRDESGTRGPEYRWLYKRGGDGLPRMQLEMSPRTFRVGKPEDSSTKVSFEFPGGRNSAVQGASYGSDGTTIVTSAHVIGQKQDTTVPVGTAVYSDLHKMGFPLMEAVSTESSVQDAGVLNAKAAGMLWAAADAWSLELDGSGKPEWGSYSIGDWVVLRVRHGLTPKRRSMRITGWTIKVADSGWSETITPTLQVGKWYS
jgi:hypothetical protein